VFSGWVGEEGGFVGRITCKENRERENRLLYEYEKAMKCRA